jgi:Golgi nucleoside diphosphatase
LNSDECFYSYSYILSIDDYVDLNVQPAVALDQMSIYVFWYFYDIAKAAGLLSDKDESSSISTIPIRVLKQTAKNVCRWMTTITTKEHPFLCFDLTYIYSLWTKGYGLSEDIQIHICKRIQQFEAVWLFGLALKLL